MPAIMAATNTNTCHGPKVSAVSAGPGADRRGPSRCRTLLPADQARIEVAPGRDFQPGREDGHPAVPCDPVAECRHHDGAAHHEGQARIPVAEDVEEAEHLGRSTICETMSPRPKSRPEAKADRIIGMGQNPRT